MIKIIINTIVTIVLATGTIQGAASYGEYCEKDLESFHCDFNHHQRKYDSDIDFLAVVVVSGISAFVWVRKYVYIHCYSYQHSNRGLAICDRILENSSKSYMKSSVFLHVFNDISTYVYVFTEYFLHSFSNLSIEFLVVL